MPTWLTSQRRQYAYAVVSVLLTVLVAYKLIDPTAVPLWLNVAGTVLGLGVAGTAGVATKVQRSNGTLPD